MSHIGLYYDKHDMLQFKYLSSTYQIYIIHPVLHTSDKITSLISSPSHLLPSFLLSPSYLPTFFPLESRWFFFPTRLWGPGSWERNLPEKSHLVSFFLEANKFKICNKSSWKKNTIVYIYIIIYNYIYIRKSIWDGSNNHQVSNLLSATISNQSLIYLHKVTWYQIYVHKVTCLYILNQLYILQGFYIHCKIVPFLYKGHLSDQFAGLTAKGRMDLRIVILVVTIAASWVWGSSFRPTLFWQWNLCFFLPSQLSRKAKYT